MKLKPWIAAAIIAVLYGIVSEMDYQDAVQREQIARASHVQTLAAR
jgi:hypothetical protein